MEKIKKHDLLFTDIAIIFWYIKELLKEKRTRVNTVQRLCNQRSVYQDKYKRGME